MYQELRRAVGLSRLFSFDIESEGLNTWDEVYSIAFAVPNGGLFWFKFSEGKIIPILRELLSEPEMTKIAHRIEFEARLLRKYGIRLTPPFEDTKIAQYTMDENKPNSLEDLAYNYLGVELSSFKEVCPSGDWSQVPDVVVKDYNCTDAQVTLALWDKLKDRVPPLYAFEKDLVPLTVEMSFNGIPLDVELLQKLEEEKRGELQSLEEQIYRVVGHKFNLHSSQQLGHVLFEEMQMPILELTPRLGKPATSEVTLRRLAKDYEFPQLLLKYRDEFKLYSTYIVAFLKRCRREDNRLYGVFHPQGTDTGRYSSEKPNLQNIPEYLHSIVKAPKGKKIITADYSQIELRLAACIANEERMIRAFKEGRDIHKETAVLLFNCSEISDEMRKEGKTVNFAMLYRVSPGGLASKLDCYVSEAKGIIDKFNLIYPAFGPWGEKVVEEARTRGFVETFNGRRRRFSPLVFDRFSEREAINFAIQGAAADVIKIAMINLHKQGILNNECKLILQVHDELVFEVNEVCAQDYATQIKEIMQNASSFEVPMEVETVVSDTWK